MSRSRLPRGLRKFIRAEKARIRATVSDPVEAERSVRELVAKYRISHPHGMLHMGLRSQI